MDRRLDDLFNERVPLYEKYADVVVNESNINVEETVQLTLEKIKEYKGLRNRADVKIGKNECE